MHVKTGKGSRECSSEEQVATVANAKVSFGISEKGQNNPGEKEGSLIQGASWFYMGSKSRVLLSFCRCSSVAHCSITHWAGGAHVNASFSQMQSRECPGIAPVSHSGELRLPAGLLWAAETSGERVEQAHLHPTITTSSSRPRSCRRGTEKPCTTRENGQRAWNRGKGGKKVIRSPKGVAAAWLVGGRRSSSYMNAAAATTAAAGGGGSAN